jgi:DNA-binding transcriptional MerR regulator
MEKKYTTLLELSKKFKVKKSSLIYYVQMGILVPDMIAGKTALFEEEKVITKWQEIKKLRKKYTLSEIREIFNKK